MIRRAITLLELIIVLAIIGILVALVLAGIQRVRESALLLRSENNLRQIGLAHANYVQNQDRLPPLAENLVITNPPTPGKPRCLFQELLPYLEQQALYDYLENPRSIDGKAADYFRTVRVREFLNPLDPSASVHVEFTLGFLDISSYAANGMVFESLSATPAKVSDGMSNTVFFSEHYGYRCGFAEFHFTQMMPWSRPDGTLTPFPMYTPTGVKPTRPTFADRDCMDVVPATSGSPPVTSVPGNVTFQVKPKIAECDPRLPNASSSRGLQVLMGDGSVRILRPSIASEIFWAAVTPSGGETIGLE